jgi:hypothetical protein
MASPPIQRRLIPVLNRLHLTDSWSHVRRFRSIFLSGKGIECLAMPWLARTSGRELGPDEKALQLNRRSTTSHGFGLSLGPEQATTQILVTGVFRVAAHLLRSIRRADTCVLSVTPLHSPQRNLPPPSTSSTSPCPPRSSDSDNKLETPSTAKSWSASC